MYKHQKHSVGNNLKHIQITTKYRYEILRSEIVKKYCEIAIQQVCKKHGIEIEIINVQPNHVHLIVNCPRTLSDSKLLQLIKGGSSYLIFRKFPSLKKVYTKGNLWNGGYFCTSVGGNYNQVFNYIKNQDEHHKERKN